MIVNTYSYTIIVIAKTRFMKLLKEKMPNNVFPSLKHAERQRDFLDENICGAPYRDDKSLDFRDFCAQNSKNSNHISQDHYQS